MEGVRHDSVILFSLVLILAAGSHGVLSATYVGCFRETRPFRTFDVSAYEFDPSELNVLTCRQACLKINQTYAALTQGKYCFCGQDLGDTVLENDFYCNSSCSGDASDFCGGPDHVSVWTTPAAIDYAKISTSDSGGTQTQVFPAGESVSFVVNVVPDLTDPLIRFDYEGQDGNWEEVEPVPSTHSRVYSVPGLYTVTAYITDSEQINPLYPARTRILITGSPRAVEVSCNKLYYRSNELMWCDAEVREGFFLDATVDYGNSMQETFSLQPITWSTAGAAIPTSMTSATSNDGSGETYVQRMWFFQSDGELLAFEYYATATGDITFAVLRPSCAFCTENNQCTSCTPGLDTCSADVQFCPANHNCADSCQPAADLYGSAPESYAVVKAFSYSISDVGRGIYDVRDSVVSVKRGDVVGYATTGTGRLATRPVNTGELSDSNPTFTLSDGNSGSDVSAATATDSIHYVRAIAATPIMARLFNTYPAPGTYTITMTATGRYQTGSAQNSTTVIIQDPISNLTLLCPEYGQSGVETVLKLDTHTGTDVTYTWWVDDKEITNTTIPEFAHTFPDDVIYNITVRGLNKVSEQWTSCIIEMQDPLMNLQVVSEPSVTGELASFVLNMTNGSKYTCTWEWDDNTAVSLSNDTLTPITGLLPFKHTYKTPAIYEVQVTCANNVSQQSVTVMHPVQDPITGITLVTEGALRNVPLILSFEILSGTDPTFILDINNTIYPVQADQSNALVWVSVSEATFTQTGLYTLSINGSNLISSIQFVSNFTVDSPIKNVTIVVSELRIEQNETVTFNLSMLEGTSVHVEWSYGDGGSPDTLTLPTLVSWPSGSVQSRTHAYTVPGIFNATVTLSNNYNHFTYAYTVYVFNKVDNVIMTSNSPVAASSAGSVIYFTFISLPYPPTLAKVTFLSLGHSNFSVANLQDLPYGTESRSQLGSNRYLLAGDYKVVVNVSNPISWKIIEYVVSLVVPITTFTIVVVPPHASVNTQVSIAATVEAGNGITYYTDWGDGTGLQVQKRTGTNFWEFDYINHTYSAVDTYNITIIASNVVGNTTKTYRIVVQHPVTTDFQFYNPAGPVEFTGEIPVNLTLRLEYPSSGAPLPSDASYVVEWGDGQMSTSELLSFTSTDPYVLDLFHSYQGPGDWVASIKIWNLASVIVFNASAGIYNRIEGVRVEAFYRPLIPTDGPFLPGIGDGYTFPLDLPVSLLVSLDKGEPALYMVEAHSQNGNSDILFNSTDNPTLVYFEEAGTYTLTLTAWTPLNGESVTLNLTLEYDVTDIALSDGNRTIKPGEVETYTIAMATLNPVACAVINFDSSATSTTSDSTSNAITTRYRICGSNCTLLRLFPTELQPEVGQAPVACPMTNPLQLEHLYADTGYYVITADVYTQFGSKHLEFPVTVSAENCQNPKLSFTETSTDFLQPTRVARNHGYLVSTETRCVCKDCTNVKRWSITEVNRVNGTDVRLIDMTPFTSYNKSDLYIPAKTLLYGLYRVCYKVTMNLTPFQSKICAFIDIIASPLKVSIVAQTMSLITVPWKSTIIMSPRTYSSDPDVIDDEVDDGLTFVSFCKQQYERFPLYINGTPDPNTVYGSAPYSQAVLEKAYSTGDFTGIEDEGGCFRQGPGSVENPSDVLETSGHIEFSGLNMLPNESYIWITNGTKDNRRASSILEVDVSIGEPPALLIRCKESYLCRPTSDCLWFNSMNTLRLRGSCLERCDDVTNYVWSFYRAGLNGAWLVITDQDDFIQGRFSTEVSVDSKMFDQGFAYYSELIRYRVTVEATGADGSKGKSSSDVCLNKPPSGGNCTLTEEGATRRKIVCENFTDPDGIATYLLMAQYKGEPYPRTLDYFEDNQLVINMPYGARDDDYYMQIYVKILDVHGAYTVVDLGRHRVAPENIDFDAFLENLKDEDALKEVINNGNIKETTSLLLMYAAILNGNSKNTLEPGSEFYGAGIPPYEEGALVDPNMSDKEKEDLMKKFETKRDRNAELRTSMIESVGNLTTQGNITTIQLVATTMSQLTTEPGELNRDSQITAKTWVNNVVGELESIKDDISLDDLVVVADSLLHVTDSLFMASEINNKYPTNTDMKEAAESGFFTYDTNWYTNRKAIIGVENADYELTYESSGLIQNTTTAATVPDLLSSTQIISKMMIDKMVPGEGAITLHSNSMDLYLAKNKAKDVLGTEVNMTDGTSVNLPDYCDIVNGSCDPEEPVSLSVTSIGPSVYSFISTPPDSVRPSGTVIVIDLYDRNDEAISVRDVKEPIEFGIPRKEGLDDPGNVTTIRLSANVTLQHSFCRSVQVTDDVGLLIEVIPQDPDMRLVTVVKFGEFPSLIENSYHHYAYSPQSMTNRASPADEDQYRREHTLFLSNSNVTHFRTISGSDTAYFCVRQLNSSNATEFSLTGPPYLNIVQNDVTPFNVTTRTPLVSCVYVDTNDNGVRTWSTSGMEVQPETTVTRTICSTRHLSSFSSGWVVQPNAIDFEYVLDNMDFYKNLTLYVSEIIILIIYICFAIWARRKDMKDTLRLGVTPLPDNDPLDRYYYEIVVQTGLRKNAATDSKVYFILSGEYDETDVRVFEDPERKIFRRGAQDSFLMTTERPLGPLTYARVWHDNSGKGKYQSWYLNYMIVHDLQTKERFYFIANEWFAVEESDGQIDRLLPVAGPEQMRELGHLLANSATKKLADDHIWFSVIARPPESRFTRFQRLSCCLCLLFTSMLANAMYYEKLADGAGRNGLTFGPFSMTPEQIYVGVISNLVVFPVNFLIVTLFRKSRPRRKRSSRLMEAIRKNEENTKKPQSDPNGSGTDLSMFVTSTGDLRQDDQRSETPVGDTSDLTRPLEPGLALGCKPVVQERTKSRSLPWWCMIISWIILWMSTLVSAIFVTMYGIQFGDEKTRKWITSLIISFLTSIFLTQPIKVFLAALLFSLIFKKSDLIDEVAEEDEEELRLGDDETWLHPQTTKPGEGRYTRRQRKLAYSPPDPELLKQARENRIKEMKMYDIIREILFYSIFLWVLLVLSYGFRDPNAYFMKENVQSTLTDLGLGTYGVAENSFVKILKMGDFWDWCENTMIPAIRAGPWYNGDQPYGQRGFMYDRISRLMGYVVLRQLRIKKNQCDPVAKMRQLIPECYTPYSMWSEDREDYGVGWVPFEGDSEKNNSGEEWRYRGAIELEGWPYIGGHAIYGGGGYVVELRENVEGLREKLARLKEQRWLTRETRAVFIEFTVYNAFVNLFGITTFIAEFINTGGIQVYTRVEPMNLLGYRSGAQLFQVICQAMYAIFIVFFIVKECRKIFKERKDYFKEPWNYIELSIIMLSLGGLVIYTYRLLKTKELVARFAENHGNTYMKFQYVGYWNELLLYMLGWLVYLATVKFIRLLRFNKRMSLLAQTLRHGAKPLLMFGIMFGIIFFAYTQLFYFVYFMELTNFSNVIFAAETCMQMLVGKFNFNAMKGASPVLGPFFFFCYVVTVYYILINMFLTILNESFASVRRDIALQSNEYEMIEFIVKRFSDWTGISLGRSKSRQAKKPGSASFEDLDRKLDLSIEDQIDHFPERVDRLMDTISKVFLDQSTFESLFLNSNKARSKDAMKLMMKSPEIYGTQSNTRY